MPAGARAGQSTGPSSPWSTPRNPDSAGSRPASGGSGGADGTQDTGAGPEFWPFAGNPEEDNDVHTGKEGRGWLRTAIVIGVLLVLVVAVAIAFNRGRQDGGPQTDSGPSQQPSSSAQAQGAPVELAGVSDFDPLAEPPEENPDEAPNAIDGDPATSWTTSTYRGDPALGGLKPGVGLMVDLGKDQEVRSVTVRFKGAPTSFEVYAAPAGVTEPPDSIDQLDKVGGQEGRAAAGERAARPEREHALPARLADQAAGGPRGLQGRDHRHHGQVVNPGPHPDPDGERDDLALLEAHIAGDPAAFGELFARHRNRLWAVALRTTGNPEDAADALQDALISAFKRAESFRGDSAVTTWLHRIVVNACLDRLRRAKVRLADPAAGRPRGARLPGRGRWRRAGRRPRGTRPRR